MPKYNAMKGTDVTLYARSIGYGGIKNVIVKNSKVISHRNQDWFSFCEKLRSK